jgi:sugar phosphate isomerase/epimerase
MRMSRREVLAGAASLGAAHAAAGERYRLGCQTLPYRNFPLARAIEGIRKAGYRYVMPFATHEGKPVYTPALPAAERAELKRRFADAGLTPIMAFAGLSGDIRKPEGMKTFLGEIDLAADFGIPVVVGAGPWYYTKFPTVPKRSRDWKAECDEFCGALERGVKHAETTPVTVTLKPHTGITATAAACLALVRRIVSDRFKICWDAGNVSFYEGIYPDPDLEDLAPFVKGVCIKDHKGLRAQADFPVPGEGQIDHEAMFRTLFAGGFSGPMTVERVDGKGEPVPPEVLDERVARAFHFLTPLLERAAGT